MLLVTAKATADAFLGAMMLAEPAPWVVPVSLAADAAMGSAVVALRRLGRRAPVRPRVGAAT